ncbi:hypothetical protein F2P81_001870 [Scophthalmus maximus]|uniref:Uncharacterized protein n=1 Tax=Scophthalmus maximus TaxID=52904 RepID=A0A6A4TRG5_SCOMX|nr:hypothetical protein F2P81_001870 [Scophthalmus maximus]
MRSGTVSIAPPRPAESVKKKEFISLEKMNCFSERWRRTSPMRGSSRNDLVPPKPPRKNGWSWPPQAFQVFGWLVYGYFAIVDFGIYIPLLPLPWNHVLYSVLLCSTVLCDNGHVLARRCHLVHLYSALPGPSQSTNRSAVQSSHNYPVSPHVVYTVYKGISTYDYVKMQRQKEARSRDAEADEPNDAKAHNKAPQNPKHSIDCEPALSQSSSTCKFDDKGALSDQISRSICTELENFRKSAKRENSFHYGTGNPTENTAKETNDGKSRKPNADEEAQSPSVTSVDSGPVLQDPLGSSVMTPDDTCSELGPLVVYQPPPTPAEQRSTITASDDDEARRKTPRRAAAAANQRAGFSSASRGDRAIGQTRVRAPRRKDAPNAARRAVMLL